MSNLENYNVKQMALTANVEPLKFEKNIVNKVGVAAMVYLDPANQMTMKEIASKLGIKVKFLSDMVVFHKMGNKS